MPGQPEPLDIPRGSEALFVLQHIRDEAHRFAITYHRQKRARRALRSPLDDIPGVGASRKKALLKRFGSLTRLRTADVDELPGRSGRGAGPGAHHPRAPPRRSPRPRGRPGDRRGDRRQAWRSRPARSRPTSPRSRSSPACPGRAGRRRRSASRTSATSWSTTSPRRSSARWPSWPPPPAGPGRVAIVADVRGGVFFGELSRAPRGPPRPVDPVPDRVPGGRPTRTWSNRFEATRRRHPLAPADRVVEGIRKERLMMESLKGDADLIIDTSGLSPHELRDRVREASAARRASRPCRCPWSRSATSTACPATPTWCSTSASCPTRTGSRPPAAARHRPQGEGVRHRPAGVRGVHAAPARPARRDVPGLRAEGKSYLTIAVGCTGGRHRSVVVCEALAAYFREERPSRAGRPPRPRATPSRRRPRPGTAAGPRPLG